MMVEDNLFEQKYQRATDQKNKMDKAYQALKKLQTGMF